MKKKIKLPVLLVILFIITGMAKSGKSDDPVNSSGYSFAEPPGKNSLMNPATQVLTPCDATFTFTGAIETFTVPAGVFSITIEATGARGGHNIVNNKFGGIGTNMKGNFTVVPGEQLLVLVGQKGGDGPSKAGGGGGSFVTRYDVVSGNVMGNTLLLAAGGGGGAGGAFNGINASTGLNGLNGNAIGGWSDFGIGGQNGMGGGPGNHHYPCSPDPSGGGGFLGNGSNSPINCLGCFVQGGQAAIAGGNGGVAGGNSQVCSPFVSNGGFGGGGGTGSIAGGGGGGYSGGGGGGRVGAGGGGSSFNAGSNQVNLAGVNTSDGNGLVVITWGTDNDGDTWKTCEGDCNDANSAVNPGAPETCNGIDDDCDGLVDEGFDQDNDGWTTCGGDCNDNNFNINPGMTEICDNGLDDNCDGLTDVFSLLTLQDLMNAFNAGVANGSIAAANGGGQLTAFSNNLQNGNLQWCLNRCDGQSPPPDFLVGSGVSALHDLIAQFIANQACSNGIPLLAPPDGSTVAASQALDVVSPDNRQPGSRSSKAAGSPAGSFQLYPNPASQTLYLDLHNYLEQQLSITIYNHLGQQVVHLPEWELHEPVLSIDLTKRVLPEGVYLLSVRTAEGQLARQFVIAE